MGNGQAFHSVILPPCCTEQYVVTATYYDDDRQMNRTEEPDRIACVSPLGPFENFLTRGAIGMSDDPAFNILSSFLWFCFPSLSRSTSLLDYGRSPAHPISTKLLGTNFNA